MKALKEAINSRLHGDATLLTLAPGDVHDTLAPDGTPYRYVVYQLLGSTPDWTLGAQVCEEFLLQVKVIDEGRRGADFTGIENAKARLLWLLNDYDLVVAGKATWVCRYSGEVPDYAERDAAGQLLMQGGLRFRIVLA